MNGFDPIFDQNSRVLILGSFPSVISRANGFYYGNKQNRFWKTLSKIFDQPIEEDISAKIKFLKMHNIALFDIVKSSDLIGSADSKLGVSKIEISDISLLLPPHTRVEKILCNGKTAFNLTISNTKTDIPIIYLPSTSPANVRFDENAWQNALKFLK